MDGTLDQFEDRRIHKGATMADETSRPRRATYWDLLGASGLLQPLSGEFLYRSPEESLRVTCRRVRPSREKAHVVR